VVVERRPSLRLERGRKKRIENVIRGLCRGLRGGKEGTNKDMINIQASLKKFKKEDFSTGPGEVDERGARLWGMGHETGGEGGSRRSRDVRCAKRRTGKKGLGRRANMEPR
jgi:hypothetical protein